TTAAEPHPTEPHPTEPHPTGAHTTEPRPRGSGAFSCGILIPQRKFKMKLAALLFVAIPAMAQVTVKDALVKHWKTSQDFTLAVAKLMPADSYGFKPVPEEMSFGAV